jgi:hypothetical protein
MIRHGWTLWAVSQELLMEELGEPGSIRGVDSAPKILRPNAMVVGDSHV